MIDKLLLNKRYFRSKAGKIILPEHLDSQFNNIANYINNDLIPYIESINFDATNGKAGYPFAVFCNINNNDAGYQYLNDINIDDNLLSLNKLSKVAAGSILGSNIAGNIITITPTDTDQLIFLGDNNPEDLFDLPDNIHFRKIKSEDIVNNSLTGQQIAVVANDNFIPGTFLNLIPDNSLLANNLINVNNNNIALGAIDFRHIGVFDNLPYNVNIAGQVLLNDFDDNSITVDKIQDGTIRWVNFTVPQPINAVNLLNGFIKDAHFKPYVFNTQPPGVPNLANLIASNFNAIVNFPAEGVQVYNNIQLTADKITLNCLSAANFTQDIQNAIIKYQQIKQQALQPPPQPVITAPTNYYQFLLDGLNLKTNLGREITFVRLIIDRDVNPKGFYWWYMQYGDGKYYVIQNVHSQNYNLSNTEYFNFYLLAYIHNPIAKSYFAAAPVEINYGAGGVYPKFFVF